MDYKVGDILKHIKDGEMCFGKIEIIKGNELWCHWSRKTYKIPRTIKEFEALQKRDFVQYVTNDSEYIKGTLVFNNNKRIS